MSPLPWFKMHYEARNDKKLEELTDAQHRVWFSLLCYAAEQREDRGTVPARTTTMLAREVARKDEALLESTIAALIDLEILERQDDGSLLFLGFLLRQYDKPSDAPEATAKRQAEKRKRDKEKAAEAAAKAAQESVTRSHAESRGVTPMVAARAKRTPSKGSQAALYEAIHDELARIGKGIDADSITPDTQRRDCIICANLIEDLDGTKALAPIKEKDGSWEPLVRQYVRFAHTDPWYDGKSFDVGLIKGTIGRWIKMGRPETYRTPGVRKDATPRQRPDPASHGLQTG